MGTVTDPCRVPQCRVPRSYHSISATASAGRSIECWTHPGISEIYFSDKRDGPLFFRGPVSTTAVPKQNNITWLKVASPFRRFYSFLTPPFLAGVEKGTSAKTTRLPMKTAVPHEGCRGVFSQVQHTAVGSPVNSLSKYIYKVTKDVVSHQARPLMETKLLWQTSQSHSCYSI